MAPIIKTKLDRQQSSEMLLSVRKSSLKKFKSCPTFGIKSRKVSFEDVHDVIFLIGPSKKKFISDSIKLAAASEVFKVMLLGSFKKMDIIEILDVDPSAFKLVLKSIYDGVTSIQQNLTVDLAFDIFYCAHKYSLTALEVFLIKFIQRKTTVDNVLQILHHGEFYGIVSIQSKCWSIIEKQTSQVIRGEDFQYISWNILCGILENSRLRVSEYDLFRATMRWCITEAHRDRNKGKNLQEIIGVAIYKIRFPLMSEGEFQLVMRKGILKWGEIEDLKCNFRKNKTFCHFPRKNWCNCRKNHIQCSVCCNHGSFVPIDGLLGMLDDKKVVKNEMSPSTINNCSECECRKYFSCPAYPNGTTAIIMDNLSLGRKVNIFKHKF